MIHEAMLKAYPKDLSGLDGDAIVACVGACIECAQACTACADACLGEDMVAEMTACIRRNLDCADICETTGRALSRHTGSDAILTKVFLDACATACKCCGDECARHSHLEHCQVCAEVCRKCEEACRNLLASLRHA